MIRNYEFCRRAEVGLAIGAPALTMGGKGFLQFDFIHHSSNSAGESRMTY